MTNTLTTIQSDELTQVTGGEGVMDTLSSGVNAVRNFGSGFAAGATFGPNAKSDQVAKYGDRNATGFKPGVESGMMFNMALGPVGRGISALANRVPGGGSQ